MISKICKLKPFKKKRLFHYYHTGTEKFRLLKLIKLILNLIPKKRKIRYVSESEELTNIRKGGL